MKNIRKSRKAQSARPGPASRYLDELLSFGGEPHTRAEVIALLQAEGHPPGCIDRWLQGQELASRLRERRERTRLRLLVPPSKPARRKASSPTDPPRNLA